MKTGISAALALTLVAGQAQALECAAFDVLDAFRAAALSPDKYQILHGSFDFLPGLLPGDITTRGDPNLPPPAPFAADFTGKGLTADGFTSDVAMPVTLQSLCAGPWCGQIGIGQDVLVFARSDDQGRLVVELHPCVGWVFPDPTAAMLDQMLACTTDPGPCLE